MTNVYIASAEKVGLAFSKRQGPCQSDVLEGALQAVLLNNSVPSPETIPVGNGGVRLDLVLEEVTELPLELRPPALLRRCG